MAPALTGPIRAIWLILPVVMAGLGHVLLLKTRLLQPLALPVDGGRQWKGRPLLGPNKTWRGVLVMTVLTGWLTSLQAATERRMHLREVGVGRNYRLRPWPAGSIVGLAYCLAELPNSFLKRRLGVPPGGRSERAAHLQYLVDQLDSVIGCLLALRMVYRPQRGEMMPAFVLGSLAHIAVDQLLYRLGVKRRSR